MMKYEVQLRPKKANSSRVSRMTHTVISHQETSQTLDSIWKAMGINPNDETAKADKVLRIIRIDENSEEIVWSPKKHQPIETIDSRTHPGMKYYVL